MILLYLNVLNNKACNEKIIMKNIIFRPQIDYEKKILRTFQISLCLHKITKKGLINQFSHAPLIKSLYSRCCVGSYRQASQLHVEVNLDICIRFVKSCISEKGRRKEIWRKKIFSSYGGIFLNPRPRMYAK